MSNRVPDHSEAAEYYWKYLDRIQDTDICGALERQGRDTALLLRGVSEEQSRYRYAEGKWSVRESVGHIIDTERVFVFRAFWFARALGAELPSFDQNTAVPTSNADARTLASLVVEFEAVRAATLALFRSLPEDAWTKTGVASGERISVRALAYITAGHADYHNAILRERYLASV